MIAQRPHSVPFDLVRRLGLDDETVAAIEAHDASSFRFDADRETIAEFFLWLTHSGLDIDDPAAVAWWDDHGPEFDATLPAICPRCASPDIRRVATVPGRPAFCAGCNACVEGVAE